MAHIALVTAAAARGLDDDLAPLVEAIGAEGGRCSVVEWDAAATDWSQFDLAIVRSTWDYTTRIDEFLDWTRRVSQATTLLNPHAVLDWNTDKHYLGELARAGIAVVPSFFAEPDDDRDAASAVDAAFAAGDGECVVKPAIGAGSRDARRFARSDRNAAIAHAAMLIDDRRAVVAQPYLRDVDRHGETALIHFEGVFSHAIRKGPLLRRGEAATRALFAPEHITPREPDADERALAACTLAAIPFEAPLLYARVDLIRAGDGPRVLELELAEPSLFFAHAEGSARRFARAILARSARAGR